MRSPAPAHWRHPTNHQEIHEDGRHDVDNGKGDAKVAVYASDSHIVQAQLSEEGAERGRRPWQNQN